MMTTNHPTSITAQPGVPFVDIVREFSAPPSAVYRAHIDPSLFAQWTGPRSMTMQDVVLEARPGGRWYYAFRCQGDMLCSFSGYFHAVEPDTLLIQTFEFNRAPGQVGIGTTRFEAVDGGTRMTVHEVYPSVEARDAAVSSGMESGIVEGYERLDEMLDR